MDYNSPLLEGQLIKRYKRFFADVRLDGKIVVAHVPNTGSLKGICDAAHPCRLQPSDNPERKLKFTLEQVKTETSWVGVNTHIANTLAWEAYTGKKIPHWAAYSDGVREVKINDTSRLDMKLTNGKKNLFIEVKSVTLAEKTIAYFPDAVTARGQKHLLELIELKKQGHETELLFVIQREDCKIFRPADAIDPEYGRLLRLAHKSGVKITAYPTRLLDKKIELNTDKKIRIEL
jgi:sugar fermentation stimulation protein A